MAKKSPLEDLKKDEAPKEGAKEKKDVVEKPEEAVPQAPRPTEAMGIAISEDNRDKFGKMIADYDVAANGKLPVEVALAMVVQGGGHPGKVFDQIAKFDIQLGDTDKIVSHYMKTGNTSYIIEALKNNKLPNADRPKIIDAIADTRKYNLSELLPLVQPSGKAELINHLITEKAFSVGSFATALTTFSSLGDGVLEDKVGEKFLDAYTKANLKDGHFDKADFLGQTASLASKFKNPNLLNTLAEKYPA